MTISQIAATVGFNVEDESKFDIAKFREHLNRTYTPTETILKDETLRKKIVGKVLGSLATKAAQEFELRANEVDGKPLEEIFGLAKNRYSAIIADLSEKEGQGSDKKMEELQLLVKTKDESIKALEEKYTADIHQWEDKVKSIQLNNKLDKAYNALYARLTDDYHKNELVKTGFEAHIANTYVFELGTGEEVLVKEKATGELVKSKSKPGSPASVEEVLLAASETKGVLKKNNAPPKQLVVGKKQLISKNAGEEIKVHPNAMKRIR